MRKDYGADDGIEGIQSLISSWKNDLISPEEALSNARTPQEQTAASVYTHYNRTLKAYNAVDFDDLIGIPVMLFRDHPDVLEKWQFRIRYMLVDDGYVDATKESALASNLGSQFLTSMMPNN